MSFHICQLFQPLIIKNTIKSDLLIYLLINYQLVSSLAKKKSSNRRTNKTHYSLFVGICPWISAWALEEEDMDVCRKVYYTEVECA